MGRSLPSANHGRTLRANAVQRGMETKKSVLVVGILPELVDFTPFPGMTAEKVRTGIAAQIARLGELGYDAHHLFIDLGETAEATFTAKLGERRYDCIIMGAGLRV